MSDPQGSTSQPIRYQGQYEDEESGLYYNRHRYYDPQLGRYVNQDPIGLLGGMNTYAYPHAPTGWVDPRGLGKALVTAVCSIVPIATPFCAPVSLGSGAYAAYTEFSGGNYKQFFIDVIPMATSKVFELISRKAGLVSDVVSNAVGVGAGFIASYSAREDNHNE